MKKKIAIIYILLFTIALTSCEDKDAVIVNEVTVGFVKGKLDVGENTDILDIPIVVTGARASVKLDLVANITATDGTAIKDVDYQLIDNSVGLNSAGKYVIQVKILDNKTMLPTLDTEDKSFKISIASVVGKAKVKISEVEVFIVSDEIFITPTIAFEGRNFDVYRDVPNGIVEVPIIVSGVKADVVLDLVANITAAGTAVEGTHYKLETKSFTINKVGKYLVKIKILDYVFTENLNLTLSVSVVGNARITASDFMATIKDAKPILVWSDSFETAPSNWSTEDLDGDGKTWINPFRYQTITNNLLAIDGLYFASSASYDTSALTPDNLMLSSAISLMVGDYSLSWYDRPANQDYADDEITVYIGYDGFDVTQPETYQQVYNGKGKASDIAGKENPVADYWTARTARFSLTEAKSVKIVFRHHHSSDQMSIHVDKVELSASPSAGIAPNSTQQLSNITNSGSWKSFSVIPSSTKK